MKGPKKPFNFKPVGFEKAFYEGAAMAAMMNVQPKDVYDSPKLTGVMLFDEAGMTTSVDIHQGWTNLKFAISDGFKFKRRIIISDSGDEQEPIKAII